jgi:hypothetical protein
MSGSTGVDAPVECGDWQKNCYTSSAKCPGMLSWWICQHQTAIFLVVYGKLRHGDVTALLNKNSAYGGQNERSPDTFWSDPLVP